MTDEERFGIGELAEAADVSVRTVRYYIAEGLLPPAVTAGARSYYTREHLDRLRAIGRLKEAYFPLREIRRQLATLDDRAIREIADDAFVTQAEMHAPPELLRLEERPGPSSPAPDSAGIIDEQQELRPPRHQPPYRDRDRPGSASAYIARVLAGSARSRAPVQPGAGATPPREAAPEPVTWRRIAIGDDAELLVREEAYQRRRDKIDWLIDWARKVLE